MFESVIARWKIRLDAALKSAICAIVAGIALVLALVFFAAAIFVLAQASYGTLKTCLGFAVFFLLVAALAGIVLLIQRRSAARMLAAARASAKPGSWWLDPRVVAAGLDLGKTLGGRRAMSLGLVGAFLIGLLMSRGPDKK